MQFPLAERFGRADLPSWYAVIPVLWLFALFGAPPAYAAEPPRCVGSTCPGPARSRSTVVLVETTGSQAWKAAERRLFAEFRAMGLGIVLMPKRQARDRLLPTYARRFHALGAFQLLRQGDRGVVRIWLERDGLEPGGYRHLDVGLHGAEVVTAAVLPVVELVFTRRMGALVSPPLQVPPLVVEERTRAQSLRNPFGVKHNLASLGLGVGFSPRQIEAAPQLNIGYRTDVGRSLSLMGEFKLPLQRYQIKDLEGAALWALRVGGLAVAARGERLAFRLGPTLGAALLSGVAPKVGRLTALAGLRAQFDVVLSPLWSLVASTDAAWTLPSTQFTVATGRSRPLFQPLLSASLGVGASW